MKENKSPPQNLCWTRLKSNKSSITDWSEICLCRSAWVLPAGGATRGCSACRESLWLQEVDTPLHSVNLDQDNPNNPNIHLHNEELHQNSLRKTKAAERAHFNDAGLRITCSHAGNILKVSSWRFPVFRMIRIVPNKTQELIIQPSSLSCSCRLWRDAEQRSSQETVYWAGGRTGGERRSACRVPGSSPVCGCHMLAPYSRNLTSACMQRARTRSAKTGQQNNCWLRKGA